VKTVFNCRTKNWEVSCMCSPALLIRAGRRLLSVLLHTESISRCSVHQL